MTARSFLAIAIFVLCACEKAPEVPAGPATRPEPIVVSASYKDENYLPLLFAGFTRATGIPVSVRHGEEQEIVSELIEKRGSPAADVLLTRSVHGVWQAADEGALRPLQSQTINELVPDGLRDADGYWTATGFTTMDVVLNTAAVDGSDVSTYAELGESRYEGRMCLSTSSLAVNRTLIAHLVAEHGVRPAEIIVRGWIANLALPVFDSEEELLVAIDSGNCAVGIASSRAFRNAANANTAAITPPPGYADVEAIGIGRHARSPDTARLLVEWLIGTQAQVAHSQGNGLYPANSEAMRDFERALSISRERNVGVAGLNAVDAIKLAERAAWR